jgi:hypothetical protein
MWPLVKKMLKISEFSKEVPRNMLRTVSLMNDLGSVLQGELKAQDEAFEKAYGVPMTAADFEEVLESFRQKDLELYKTKSTRKKSQFHKIFRSSGKA